MAKYVMTWTQREGADAASNEASAKRSLAVFSNWTPSDDVNFVEFLSRADGEGGFAVVECDEISAVALEMTKFAPFFEFHLYPVLEVADGAGLAGEAIAFRDSV